MPIKIKRTKVGVYKISEPYPKAMAKAPVATPVTKVSARMKVVKPKSQA